MKFTQKSPMSAQQYKDAMFWLRAVWIFGAILVGLMCLLPASRMLIGGQVSADEIVLSVGVILVCGLVSWLVRRRARTIDHEWHLYRGNILEVNTSPSVPGCILVLFDGDGAYTRFTTQDYQEHKDILQPDKNLVLVARRSIKFGAPTYEAVVYKHH